MYTCYIEWSMNIGYWQPTAAISFMPTPNFRHRHGYTPGCHGHYPHSYPRVSLSRAIATYVALRGRCCRVVAIATLLLSCPLRLRHPPPPPPPPRRRRGVRYVVVVASLLLSHRPCPRPPRLRPRLRERARERESKEAMAQCAQSCVLYRRFRTLSPVEGKDVQGGDCVRR